MKLSEAIRLGAMMGPQAFGQASDGVGRCAMASACAAVGERYINCFIVWPWIHDLCSCPVCDDGSNVGIVITVHLNDTHRWPRERIADWVATIEPEELAVGETRNEQADRGEGPVRASVEEIEA